MTLTTEQIKELNRPFTPDEHEFLRGFVYVRERAICDRLEQIDPSWTFELKSLQVRDADCVAVGSLTVGGVYREGVGMAKISDKGAGEPEKSAATDALKRAARLFGVGRYLLDAPDERAFPAWLARLRGTNTPADQRIQLPAGPVVNGWTREQHNTLALEAKRNDVTPEQLLKILDVAKVSDFVPGFGVAREWLQAYLNARPATPAPLPDDLFAGDADPEPKPAKERSIR
jgi:hypothetical protein